MGGLAKYSFDGVYLCHRLAGDLGDTSVGRFLVEDAILASAWGMNKVLWRSASHGWPDGLLHEPPVRSLFTGKRAGKEARPASPCLRRLRSRAR